MIMHPLRTRFVADAMLGRLSKWLRVMGYDTHYQPYYRAGRIDEFVRDGRLLLSRNRNLTKKYNPSLLIETDHVPEQLHEMREKGYLSTDNSHWFTRCLICNTPLERIPMEQAGPEIPEYVYSQNISGIRLCPSCGRYFWPGSHKTRMINQMSGWNLATF